MQSTNSILPTLWPNDNWCGVSDSPGTCIECREQLMSGYPEGLDPKNKTHQALSSLYKTWMMDKCIQTYVSHDNDFYGALFPQTIAYLDQRSEIVKLASTRQFQKDCEKIKPQLCRSRLPEIFKTTGNDFLKNLCKNPEK